MSWKAGWTYRKAIVIAHTDDGAQTNYQMKLLVGESSGASGEEVDCGGHCASDFDDLRFTTSDGTTLCDYWIESISGVSPNQLATVWVEIPSIAAHPDDTTIYMYYGNASASAVSSGANVFIVFDDFERGSNGDAIGGSWTIESGDVDISTEQKYGGTRSAKLIGGVARPSSYITCANSNNIAIRVRIYKEDATDCYPLQHGDGTQRTAINVNATEDIFYLNSVPAWVDTGDNATADQWQLYELKNFNWANHTNDIYLAGVSIQATATMFTNNGYNDQLDFQGDVVATQDVYIDDVVVRNYTPNEPTWGSFGSQETIYTTVVIPIGLAVSASRKIDLIRTATVLIGEAVTASRVAAYNRAASVAIGVVASATRISGRVRTATVAVGQVVTASVGWNLPHKLKLFARNLMSLILSSKTGNTIKLNPRNQMKITLTEK